MRRFFIDKNDISNDIAFIKGDEFNHLTKVLRLKNGDEIIILVGDGFEYKSEIISMDKNFAKCKINQRLKCAKDSKVNVTVFQAIPKGDKLELIVQKLAELGINMVIPFESQFSISNIGKNKIERLQKISKEASKQCGRSQNLIIGDTLKFGEVLNLLNNYDLVILAYENEKVQNLKDIITLRNFKNIALIVGSEGGFSETEYKSLVKAKVNSITLGKRILRTETAAICLSAVVMYEFGEWE